MVSDNFIYVLIYFVFHIIQWAKWPKNSLKECVLLIRHSKYTPTDVFAYWEKVYIF